MITSSLRHITSSLHHFVTTIIVHSVIPSLKIRINLSHIIIIYNPINDHHDCMSDDQSIIDPSLHPSITPTFQCFFPSGSIASSLHCSNNPSLHQAVTLSLHLSITALPLHHSCFITPLLPSSIIVRDFVIFMITK
jgi:hypothetical protein